MKTSRLAVSKALSERTYGVPARLRGFRREARTAGELVRWVPLSWFVDPLTLADMTSPWERAWIARYFAREFQGNGEVVELGTWLGSATLAIVDGLDRNPLAYETEAHVYDLFRADYIEERLKDLPVRERFRDGESFLPQYLQRLGARSRRVVVHQGDVKDQSWPRGRPIQFLFNDLSKSWDVWNHIKSTFFPEMHPGALVVEQDWVHSCTPWLHLWHFRNREILKPICHIPHSGSVVFRTEFTLPASALEPDSYDDYSSDEVAAAFDWASGIVDPARQADVRSALVHLHTIYGDLDVASRLCVDQLAVAPSSDLLNFTVPELSRRLADRDRATVADG